MIIFGIETSCDETGIAIVENENRIISSSLTSQVEIHSKYGGVVPELAARKHSENIDFVVDSVIETSGLSLDKMDGIAVTYGPGLPGALLTGLAYAKSLAMAYDIPLIPVNHIEAHIESVKIEYGESISYPALGMIVSGGHTSLFHIPVQGRYSLIGKTRDDASGEAFDKVAKLLGLGYPGGPIIDKLYHKGDPDKYFFKSARFSDGSADYSFSGLKTAVLKIIRETPDRDKTEQFINDLAASFQKAAIRMLIKSIERAAYKYAPGSIFLTGGVAVNSLLRKEAQKLGNKLGVKILIPSAEYCTDNGVMVAALGCRLFREGKFARLDLDIEPNLKLGESNTSTDNKKNL